MNALLLVVLLTAAPGPGAERARALAAAASWDELYLAFAAAKPGNIPAGERAEVASLLLKGATTLEEEDPILAQSLAEKAVAVDPTAAGFLCLARVAIANEQRGAAEEALTTAHRRFPADSQLALALGRFLLEDNDAPGALKVLGTLKRGGSAKEQSEVRQLIASAQARITEDSAVRREARRIEARATGQLPREQEVRPVRGEKTGRAEPASLSYESGTGPGGVRTRSNGRFQFKYFSNDRDFGQRADYEGKVAAALDEAYQFTRKSLGRARETPVDVVLYTREEFALHHGQSAAQRFAGMYSQGAMRISDAAELSPRTQAVLVHEYVHAVVDELSEGRAERVPVWVNEGLAELIEWRYQGSDRPPLSLAAALRGAAKTGTLPSLASMQNEMLANQPNTSLRYATSAIAVRAMLRDGGAENLVGLLREVGKGDDFAAVLSRRYSKDLDAMDREVRSELSHR